ncbi:MAG: matrixin family metalloprotease [Alphaproteobacteria bacterium]|nr:matrixin family metalloprotease [Alphaproteobacteria bacterium]
MAVQRYDRNGDGQIVVNVELLYDFTDRQKEIIWSAIDTWERVSNVDFSTHATNNDDTMTIDADGLGYPKGYWGIAYSWGEIVLDVSAIEQLSDEFVSTLVLHEIGHILGLGHTSSYSVMYPGIGVGASEPTEYDIANLESFYGPVTEDVIPVVQAGGLGVQEVVGNGGPDILYGNQGNDVLRARGGDDTLYGGQDTDSLLGGDGNDILYGNRASDQLIGGAGNDTLFGGQESDTLSGGAGDDILVGGRGGDLFIGGSGHDTIADFSAADGDLLSGSVASVADGPTGAVATFADGSSVTLIGVSSSDLAFALV